MKWLKNLMTWLFSLFCLDSFNADKHILLDFPRNGLGWISRIVHKFLIGLDTFKALGHCANNQIVSRLSKINLFSPQCKLFKIDLLILTFEQTFPPPSAKPVLEAGNGARVHTPEHDHDENKLMTLVKMGKKEKLILIDLHLDLFSFHGLCTLLEDQVQCSTTVFAYRPGQLCCRGWRSKY